MNQQKVTKYVALGDSLSEGLGDQGFASNRIHAGWPDRLAQLLAAEANANGHDFSFANLALRGSKTRSIMTSQLEAALRQKPDFITVMAGSNDIFATKAQRAEVERLFRHGLTRLSKAGISVLVVSTVNPSHLAIARHLRPKAKRITQLINRVCAELSLPVLDIYNLEELADIRYWCDDMAHFSQHGHALIANHAAQNLGLRFRQVTVSPAQMQRPDRGITAIIKWLGREVAPFLVRRVRGRSSGDGLKPKLPLLTPFSLLEADGGLARLEMAKMTKPRILEQTPQS